MTTDEDVRLERFDQRTEWPLAGAAVLFLLVFAWPILVPGLSDGWRYVCFVVETAVWVVFLIDYIARFSIARHKWTFVKKNIVDLLALALPILRPLRLLRLIWLLKAVNRRAADSLHGRIASYIVSATLLLVLCASLAVLDAERGKPGANIETFGDAVWWSFTTISTVGYGDRYPVTTDGRLVAVGLMIGGVALLGTVTASIASWVLSSVKRVEQDAQSATRADVAALRDEIRELKALLGAPASTLTSIRHVF